VSAVDVTQAFDIATMWHDHGNRAQELPAVVAIGLQR
jgi:hypothetical protein